MAWVKRTVLATALLLTVGCGAQTATVHPSPTPSATEAVLPATGPLAAPGPLHFKVDAVASGLEAPWSIAFMPGGDALVTERPGRVRVVKAGHLQAQPALTLTVASAPGTEDGLLGIALHPGFPRPADAYVFYTYLKGKDAVSRVSRFRYANGALTDERVVLDGIPGGTCCHFGGRIGFGPDAMLYVTVGDAQQAARAADRASLNGKVLRV